MTALRESSSACLQRPYDLCGSTTAVLLPQGRWARSGLGQCKLPSLACSPPFALVRSVRRKRASSGSSFCLRDFAFQELDWKARLDKVTNTSSMFKSKHLNRENGAFYKNILANPLDNIWASKKRKAENKNIFSMLTVSHFDSTCIFQVRRQSVGNIRIYT